VSRLTNQVGLAPMGLVALSAMALPQAPEPSLDELLAKAATYEQRFEQEIRTIVAHEHYEQRRSGFSPDLDANPRRQRTIESETLFVWLPDEGSWLTARNVHTVDGLPVQDSETRLERLLADMSGDWVARVRRLRDEGARFNLGSIQRNFSDPTMVVQFIGPSAQRRFRFERRGRDRVEGRPAWRLSFIEQVRPTLIQSDGHDIPAAGDVWIDAADGAVMRTRVSLRDTQSAFRLRAAIDVTYRHDSRFGIWMPARMQETYEESGRGVYRGQNRTFQDRVDCVATYTNFRRFETEVGIVPR
jgi:hypothetical protein